MCGISGIVRHDDQQVSASLLNRMTEAMAHRGPDDHQVKILGCTGLGHRRLAIVDRSPAGRQPMSDDSDSIWIVFNGEIYNHLELRQQLKHKGVNFRSHSDTEVILYLYKLYGDDCVMHLRGMFAFAIWDTKQQRLMMARDRFGQKPLLYAELDDQFIFASELKSLRQNPQLPREISLPAIHRYISMDYIPAADSVFQAVKKLPAAHQLILEDGKVRVQPYWRLDYGQAVIGGTAADRQQQLRGKFDEAVRLRMMGEVPIGVYLSGGVDSNSIAATVASVTGQQVETFSIGFAERNQDESHFAREAATYMGTKHHELILEPELESLLPHIAGHLDEPFGDPSAVPTWCLSEMASQHITVALSGEGGDEALAGYPRYHKHQIARRLWALPVAVRQNTGKLLRALIPASFDPMHPFRGLADLLTTNETSLDRVYARWLFHCDAETAARLYSAGFQQSVSLDDPVNLLASLFAGTSASNTINAMLDVDQKSYLADDLLPKLDLCTMAHSVEGRSPFLDHEFASFMAALPASDKLHRSQGKWIFRKALAGRVAPGVMNREKRGFGLPLMQWLQGPLNQMLHDTLLSPTARTRDLFKRNSLQSLVGQIRQGQARHCYLLWNLLMLELWYQQQAD